MTDLPPSDMSPEELRKWGHRLADWVADYFTNIESYRVLPDIAPGRTRQRIPATPPEAGESMEAIFADFEDVILPGITHWNHPNFFAYFSSTSSGPGILGEFLSAALNTNAMLWKTSPSATELESAVLEWLRQMLGLPEAFQGTVYDTASVSTFHALVAARSRIPNWNVRDDGIWGPNAPRPRLYASEHAHSSVDKAAIASGVGRSGLSKIGVDNEFRMDPKALEAAIESDRAAGWTPFFVCATVGTTSTTSVDPVEAIAEVCERQGLWLHVDAAYAGAVALLPERRDEFAGYERSDSFVMNPHKWLFTPIDFSALYCRHPGVLKDAFSLTPEYLKTQQDDSVINYMDYGIQLGRRFRALKFWMIVRYFGAEGLRSLIREHIRLARKFASWVEQNAAFELAAPMPFATVCFRLKGSNEANEELLERVNASGTVFISHTKLEERFTLRFSIGNLRTTEQHVREAWDRISSLAERLLPAG